MDIRQVERSFRVDREKQKSSTASRGMVSTAFPEATLAGVEMLERGGNAVDAACASALALCVCEPQACGIGGQTMAVLCLGSRYFYINGSGPVPSGLDPGLLSPHDLEYGYRATTVPTTIAVLDHMNRLYGRLKWAEIFEPAIAVAREGYEITQLQQSLQKKNLEIFQKVSPGTGKDYFLKQGRPYESGDRFRQRDLGATLEHLAQNGAQDFYIGDIARAIARDMEDHQGFLSLKDLKGFKGPEETHVLERSLNGLTFHVPPPPAPGRGLLMMLEIRDRISRLARSGREREEIIAAEIIRTVLTSLAVSPVSPAAYGLATDPLLEPGYLNEAAKNILAHHPCTGTTRLPQPKGGETTHLSVMDKDGNAVGITQSVNLVYGSKAAAKGLGFLYNNYLVDCNRADPGHPHYLKPSGLSVSMVCPTIVSHRSRPWMVTGSPGSDRILPTVYQFLSHMIYKNASMDEAMKQPRLHCPPSGRVMVEGQRFEENLINTFRKSGYEVDFFDPWSFYHGAVHSTLMCQEEKGFQGVAEVRRDGIAQGVN